ncbi:hypothetical protein KSP35_10370 [Aquihabitans sp. G128]|uniref:hypothetical protein n=1 Tax=Aquihabitans sp. G128 TaxID=2849779 RepID=UPI001C250093|nr:hypothetical protein [Aquihabitans sp. G128]QXC63146.1 hypothetical protein KSP35_10370 [Aquihabitans sp. G128]
MGGSALAALAGIDGFERLNWYDGGRGSLAATVAGQAGPGDDAASAARARELLRPAFAALPQGLFQVVEHGGEPWTAYVAPVDGDRFVVAHTVAVAGTYELRVAEAGALLVGSLLLDLATAVPRLAPADRPPADPPGSGRSARLPRTLVERVASGELAGRGAVEVLVAEGWDRDLAEDLVDGLAPPVLAVTSQSIATLDDHRTALAHGQHWVGRDGWTWQARPGATEDQVLLSHLGPDAAIRSVFEPLAWFTRWGRAH